MAIGAGHAGTVVRRGDRTRDVGVRSGGLPGRSPTTRKKCEYKKGGVCSIHGPGARLTWKPVRVPNPAPGEKKTTRLYSYVCEVGPGGGALRQPRLSFRASLKDDNLDGQGEYAHEVGTTSTTSTAGKNC